MSDSKDTQITQDAFVAAPAAAAEPLGAVIPSGTVLSGTTIYNEPWFSVWLIQTFPGTVSGGVAQPTLSGNGYGGSNNNGFVFQNDQYNTTVRGF